MRLCLINTDLLQVKHISAQDLQKIQIKHMLKVFCEGIVAIICAFVIAFTVNLINFTSLMGKGT